MHLYRCWYNNRISQRMFLWRPAVPLSTYILPFWSASYFPYLFLKISSSVYCLTYFLSAWLWRSTNDRYFVNRECKQGEEEWSERMKKERRGGCLLLAPSSRPSQLCHFKEIKTCSAPHLVHPFTFLLHHVAENQEYYKLQITNGSCLFSLVTPDCTKIPVNGAATFIRKWHLHSPGVSFDFNLSYSVFWLSLLSSIKVVWYV